jgi:amino acid adenylation domain-containing protein
MKKSTYLLSPEQIRIWFECKSNPANPAYGNPFNFELSGELNVFGLKKSWDCLIEKYPILRTSLQGKHITPFQGIFKNVKNALKFIDFSKKASFVEEYIKNLNEKIIDINSSKLCRAVLIKFHSSKYILHLNFHHIIIDGISLDYLLEDFANYYNQYQDNRAVNILEPSFPIEKNYKENYTYQEDLKHWLKKLRDSTFKIDFPLLPFSLKNEIAKSKILHSNMTIRDSNKIRDFLKKNSITLFQFVTGVMAILIYKYTKQTDIVLGYSVTTRTKNNIREVGCLVNALPIRIIFPEEITISSLFEKIILSRKEDKKHQLPLIEIVRAVRSNLSPEIRSLFNILINERTYSSYGIRLKNIICKQILLNEHFAKNDITILFDNRKNILFDLEYDVNKFEPEFLEKLFKDFIEISKKISKYYNDKITVFLRKEKVPAFYSKEEFKTYPKYYTLSYLFKLAVQNNLNKEALVFRDIKITFSDLEAKTNSLAKFLIKSYGIKVNDIVAICFNRSLEMVYSILAIIKAGAAYLPIEPKLPIERASFMIRNSAAKILIADNTLINLDLCHIIPTIFFNEIDFSSENYSCKLPIKNSNNFSYVIYTSGSTGNPKGVLNVQRGTVNRLLWMKNYFKISEKDRILLKTSYSFDVSVWEIFLPLISGATLIILEPEEEKEPEKLIHHITKNEVNFLHFVPSMLDSLLKFSSFERCSSLKTVICSGEVLEKDTVALFYKKMNNAQLYNLYGPTEASIDVTYWHCIEKNPLSDIPIGYPIDNVNLYVLDEKMHPVQKGTEGELYIGGIALASGYINDQDLTSKYFVKASFLKDEIIYKTGDRVIYLPNGALKFLGRLDRQVKLRGYRIELNEIESIIRKQKNVQEAAVILKKSAKEESVNQLIAYIQVKTADNFYMREILNRYLPSYMIPTIKYIKDPLPKLLSGKVDYKKLSLFEPSLSLEEKEQVPENKNTLLFLLKTWREILNIKNISTEENFFSIGGSSLKIIELLYFINKKFSLKFSVEEIFQNPTIKAQADIIERKRKNENSKSPTLSILSMNEDNKLSFAEERLWFVQNFSKNNPFYNMPRLFHIKGEFNLKRFTAAVEKVVVKNEVLRSVYIEKDGLPQKIIISKENIAGKIVKFLKLLGKDKKLHLKSMVEKLIHRPFCLSKFPLIFLYVFKISRKEWYVLLNINHIICDNWSLNLILKDLSFFYENPKVSIEETLNSYKQYVFDQNNFSKSKQYQATLMEFSEKLNSYPKVIKFPFDFNRPLIQNYRGALYRFQISKNSYIKLKKVQEKTNATIFSILFSCFASLIKKYSGQERFIIGTTVANRFQEEYRETVGLMANIIPVPCHLKDGESFLSIIIRTNKILIDFLKYHSLPFEKIVQKIDCEHRLDISPIFQFAFVMLLKSEDNLKLEKLTVKKAPLSPKVTKFDLTFYVEQNSSSFSIVCEYNSRIFKKETIEILSNSYIFLVENILSLIDQKKSKLDYTGQFLNFYKGIRESKIFNFLKNTISFQDEKYIPLVIDENKEISAPGRIGELCIYKHKGIKNDLKLDDSNILLKTGILAYLKNKEIRLAGESKSLVIHKNQKFYLDEISFYIKKHISVLEAAVTIEEIKKSPTIVAYYHPIKSNEYKDKDNQRIENWKLIYNNLYRDSVKKSLYKLNIIGWNNSYDGKEFSIKEIDEWSKTTANNILSYHPKNVLEIGCGVGLIAFKLFNNIESYVGTDISEKAIESLENEVKKFRKNRAKIDLFHLPNNELEKLPCQKKYFDMVVLNSVIQYFPNFTYLIELIKKIILYMPLEGKIYIGDIRNFDLIFPFHLSVQAFKSKKSYTANNLKDLAIKHIKMENELLVSPAFFILLKNSIPEIKNIEFKLKDLNSINEMNVYRYECILYINRKKLSLKKIKWLSVEDFKNKNYLAILKKYPAALKDVPIPFFNNMKNIMNFILKNPKKTLSSFKESPEDFFIFNVLSDLIKTNQYKIQFSPSVSGNIGSADVFIFPLERNPADFALCGGCKPKGILENHVNDPGFLEQLDLSSELSIHISRYFPDYMQPEFFVMLPFFKTSNDYTIEKKLLPSVQGLSFSKKTKKNILPIDLIEYFIERIWCKLFDLKKISVDDNFFDLGGDSLSAMQMIFKVNEKFHSTLPVHVVFETPTIQLLSQAVKKNTKRIQDISPIVKLRDGEGPALFLIHPLGGTIFCYEILVKKLNVKNPIYAIRDPSVELGFSLFQKIEEIAEAYIHAIREIQKTGPYILGGFSSGGNYAFEIANQLIKSGSEVKKIILWDSWARFPAMYFNKKWIDESMREQIKNFEKTYSSRFLIKKYPYFLKLLKHNMNMLLAYQPQKSSASILLFKAQKLAQNFEFFDDPKNYWGNLSKNVEVYEVNKKTHDELLTANAIDEILPTLSDLINN